MTPVEWVQVLKDSLTAAAAVTGATVAVIGLKTWERQLRGNAEYDVARRLLRTAYEARDSIASLRGTWVAEKSSALKEGRAADDFKNSQRAVYEIHMKPVIEAKSELEVAGVEGEVLWGHSFTSSLEPLHQCVRLLSVAVSAYLRYGEMDSLTESEREALRDYEEVVCDRGTPYLPDSFGSQLNDALNRIETFLRPKMRS